MKPYIKKIAINTLILLSFCLICSCNNQSGKKGNDTISKEESVKEVNITFLDGSVIKVNDLKFQYLWMFESDKQYYNPPIYSKESDELHFGIKTHGIERDSIIPQDSLLKIKFSWPNDIKNGEYRSPDSMTLVLKGGSIKRIKLLDYRLAHKFVLDSAANDERDIQFNQLNLAGVANINGKKEKFIASISMFGAIEVKIAENVKEITF